MDNNEINKETIKMLTTVIDGLKTGDYQVLNLDTEKTPETIKLTIKLESYDILRK